MIDAACGLRRGCRTLATGALGGLTVPDESITCTWTVNLALATDAVNRGAALRTGCRVEAVDVGAEFTTLDTTGGRGPARWVVNAAGLGADLIDGWFGYSRFTVTPRRGELIVYDKLARTLVDKIVLPVPTAIGKGVLVSPTIYGNVMLGPTAEDLADRTATGDVRGRFRLPAREGPRDSMPTIARRGGHRHVRGAARGHRPWRLPDRRRPGPAVRARRRDPFDRADRGHGRSPNTSRGLLRAHRAGPAAEAANCPLPPRMPNLGEAFPRPYQDDATDQRPTEPTAASSASVNGSPRARSATPAAR